MAALAIPAVLTLAINGAMAAHDEPTCQEALAYLEEVVDWPGGPALDFAHRVLQIPAVDDPEYADQWLTVADSLERSSKELQFLGFRVLELASASGFVEESGADPYSKGVAMFLEKVHNLKMQVKLEADAWGLQHAAAVAGPVSLDLSRFSCSVGSADAKMKLIPRMVYIMNEYFRDPVRRYRSVGEQVAAQVVSPTGFCTRYWKVVGTIDEHIRLVFDRYTHNQEWQELTTSMVARKLVLQSLVKDKTHDFPEVKIDVMLVTYANGFFLMGENRFVPFEEDDMPYDVCSSKYFPDQEYKAHWDDAAAEPDALKRMEADCPNFLRVLRCQDYADEDIKVLCYFLIRPRIPTKYFPHGRIGMTMQIMGPTTCGKSAIMEALIDRTLPPGSVAKISSNGHEKVFGLAQAFGEGVHTIACTEVTAKFGEDVPYSEMLALFRGEPMIRRLKGVDPVTVECDKGSYFIGQDPLYSRPAAWARIFCIYFLHSMIGNGGLITNLSDMLDSEAGAFLRLCTHYLHHFMDAFPNQSPEAFYTERNKRDQWMMKRDSNKFLAFLTAEDAPATVTAVPTDIVPLLWLKVQFLNYCQANNLNRTSTTQDMITILKGIGVQDFMTTVRYDQQVQTITILRGIKAKDKLDLEEIVAVAGAVV